MHLDDGLIQQFVDAELTPASASATRGHLAACPDCRERVAAAEREDAWVLERLHALDHPFPRTGAAAVIGTDHRTRDWARVAASVVLALGVAGAAYAAPGSPLPGVVGRLSSWMRGDAVDTTVVTRPAAEGVTGGTAVSPGDRLRIVFSSAQEGGIAIVSLTDRAVVAVRAIDGIATFTVDPDRIAIDNEGSTARFEVDIPSSASLVEIHVGTRRILAKQATQVISDTPRSADGRYRISLSTPPR